MKTELDQKNAMIEDEVEELEDQVEELARLKRLSGIEVICCEDCSWKNSEFYVQTTGLYASRSKCQNTGDNSCHYRKVK